MKILVTGGAGYIGYFVTSKLLAMNHEVTVLDNLYYGTNSLTEFKDNKNFKFIFGDIGDLKSVMQAVKGQDAVIALAAIVGDPACNIDEDETIKTNYLAIKHLIDVCKQYQVKRVVFASSCSVYGDTKDALADEDFELSPLSLYAKTRLMCEEVLLKESEYISPVILRLSTVFGVSKRMRFDLVVNFLTAMASQRGTFSIFGGDQWRPNVHVQDAAEAFIHAAFFPEDKLTHRVFNVGNAINNLTINQIGDIIVKAVPNSVALKDESNVDKRNYRVNFDRLESVLQFDCKRTVEYGVNEVLDLLESNAIENFESEVYNNAKYLKKNKRTVLVVAPAYNEEDSIDYFFSEIKNQLEKSYNLKFIITNDGSTDSTLHKLLEEKNKGTMLRIVNLAGNYGQHPALFACLDSISDSDADYVVIIDIDLQNPPKFIPRMLDQLREENYDIVYGTRKSTSLGNGLLSKIFWVLLNLFGSIYIPRDQTSLKVFNKDFLLRYKNLENRVDFFPGSLAQVPARIGYYFVSTVPRTYGNTRYDILRKIKLFAFAAKAMILKIPSKNLYKIQKVYE
ncbi:MAG TPA: NAD-dependent epimerase/dehydratase family protein [Candidatus Saccharimonadales bacterium]|nr:NAD-dependent epimerase/dehydratase family protein [Candidatus Saccharimonadales bacterium]